MELIGTCTTNFISDGVTQLTRVGEMNCIHVCVALWIRIGAAMFIGTSEANLINTGAVNLLGSGTYILIVSGKVHFIE